DAADGLALEHELGVVLRKLLSVELEQSESPIHAASVVLACNRLLPGVATLLEVDRTFIEPRFGGEESIVDLAPEARSPGTDPQELEVLIVDLVPLRRFLVDDLVRSDAELAVRHTARRRLATDHDRGRVRLDLDLALRSEARADEGRANGFAEPLLGQ